jgi:glutamyl/glutaminyl-tRNA synthetase
VDICAPHREADHDIAKEVDLLLVLLPLPVIHGHPSVIEDAGLRRCLAECPRAQVAPRPHVRTLVRTNLNDAVILKSSDQELRLPTYHFAHAVDDHLMRVNLVVRGDEWIFSVPLHLQLFAALGFKPIQYAHIAPLVKQEGKSRRKLSKRKDLEASVRPTLPRSARSARPPGRPW